MKNLIETIKNIWRIEELRKRILITLGLLLVYRIGSFVVLPGVDSSVLESTSSSSGGLVELLAIFTGGAFTRASIFALGIMPYISASIIMQLMGIAVPAVQKMQKEDSGRRKLNQWTRYLTIVICIFQAPGYIYATIDPAARPMDNTWWVPVSVVILTCSTLFVMWLGERITERGLGNGISLIIMVGILAQLPESFVQEVVGRTTGGGGGMVVLLLEVVIWLLIIAGCILLVQGTRRIPVQFAKRVVGNKQYGGVRNYIPLKVNAAGVMPIIFAQAIVLIPLYVSQAFENPPQWLLQFSRYESAGYNITLFLMVVLFTYFYTAITVNPNQLADDMKRNGGFIPGVKPGKQTAEHIDELLSRITLPGAICLGLVAILPAFAMMAGIKQGFAQFFGGTSLLIMVGVLLDTLQQIESHLLMRHYDGLMKSGRIRGGHQRHTAWPGSMGRGVNYLGDDEVARVRESSLLVGRTLAEVARHIGPGVTTRQLDRLAEDFIRSHGAEPVFKGFKGFPASLCVSVNDHVVHGIPNDDPLQEGSIVSVDCGVRKDGFVGDSAYTFAVGEVSEEVKQLMKVTMECLELGITQAMEGNRTGDIGHAVQQHAEANGYGVVRELTGHGVGRDLHEAPEVPNYGKRGHGVKLVRGMVIAIEPMINMGSKEVVQYDDGWTVATRDGKPSAHYEHTLAIKPGKPEVLTTFMHIHDVLKKKGALVM